MPSLHTIGAAGPHRPARRSVAVHAAVIRGSALTRPRPAQVEELSEALERAERLVASAMAENKELVAERLALQVRPVHARWFSMLGTNRIVEVHRRGRSTNMIVEVHRRGRSSAGRCPFA